MFNSGSCYSSLPLLPFARTERGEGRGILSLNVLLKSLIFIERQKMFGPIWKLVLQIDWHIAGRKIVKYRIACLYLTMWISCEKLKYWIAPKCKILCWLKTEVFSKSASFDFGCRLKGLEVQTHIPTITWWDCNSSPFWWNPPVRLELDYLFKSVLCEENTTDFIQWFTQGSVLILFLFLLQQAGFKWAALRKAHAESPCSV